MRVKLGLVLVVLAAVAGLLWSLGVGFPRAPEPVDTVRVRRGDLELTLTVSGTVEAHTVDLAFQLPGRVRWVVPEGQRVGSGQALAALEAGELEAEVEQARQAQRAAEEEARRALVQAQASRHEVRRAAAAVRAARAQAEQARAAWRAAVARLEELRAAPREVDVEQAEAALRAAAAALEQARRTLEVQQRLYQEGAISQVQLDAARAQYDAAKAQYEQAKAQLDRIRAGPGREAVQAATEQVAQARAAWRAAMAQVEQAEAALSGARAAAEQADALARLAAARTAQAVAARRAAEERLRRAVLRAPFSGTVLRVYLQPGAMASPGVPVLALASPARWVTAEVEEADVGKLRVGQRAWVTADAYPGLRLTAHLRQIGSRVETRMGSRVVRVRLDLDRPVMLRVGTTVDVDVVLRVISRVLLAPPEAVISSEDGGSQVYVVDRGVVRVRSVRTGERDEDHVVVLEGLREGELVAVAEPGRLRDGQRVRVRSVR